MSVEVRGGVPRTQSPVAVGTGTATLVTLPFVTKHLQVYNLGANAVRLYWTERDQAADENHVALTANGGSRDFWEGPAEIQSQDGVEEVRSEDNAWGCRFWALALVGATTLEITAFQKLA